MVSVDDTLTYLIAYSSNKTSAARLHFDIAHEQGHIFLHEWSEDIEELSKEEFEKPGEIEPDAALRFGMEFIDKYLDNRFEGVATVHTDRAHVHVHIIFNSVSFIDGKKYHAASVKCATSNVGRGAIGD